jgi:hypothetical protein
MNLGSGLMSSSMSDLQQPHTTQVQLTAASTRKRGTGLEVSITLSCAPLVHLSSVRHVAAGILSSSLFAWHQQSTRVRCHQHSLVSHPGDVCLQVDVWDGRVGAVDCADVADVRGVISQLKPGAGVAAAGAMRQQQLEGGGQCTRGACLYTRKCQP